MICPVDYACFHWYFDGRGCDQIRSQSVHSPELSSSVRCVIRHVFHSGENKYQKPESFECIDRNYSSVLNESVYILLDRREKKTNWSKSNIWVRWILSALVYTEEYSINDKQDSQIHTAMDDTGQNGTFEKKYDDVC